VRQNIIAAVIILTIMIGAIWLLGRAVASPDVSPGSQVTAAIATCAADIAGTGPGSIPAAWVSCGPAMLL